MSEKYAEQILGLASIAVRAIERGADALDKLATHLAASAPERTDEAEWGIQVDTPIMRAAPRTGPIVAQDEFNVARLDEQGRYICRFCRSVIGERHTSLCPYTRP